MEHERARIRGSSQKKWLILLDLQNVSEKVKPTLTEAFRKPMKYEPVKSWMQTLRHDSYITKWVTDSHITVHCHSHQDMAITCFKGAIDWQLNHASYKWDGFSGAHQILQHLGNDSNGITIRDQQKPNFGGKSTWRCEGKSRSWWVGSCQCYPLGWPHRSLEILWKRHAKAYVDQRILGEWIQLLQFHCFVPCLVMIISWKIAKKEQRKLRILWSLKNSGNGNSTMFNFVEVSENNFHGIIDLDV